jgi:hypothetical protein
LVDVVGSLEESPGENGVTVDIQVFPFSLDLIQLVLGQFFSFFLLVEIQAAVEGIFAHEFEIGVELDWGTKVVQAFGRALEGQSVLH